MKTKLTAFGLLFTSLAFSQVTVDETIFINTGATFYSDMAINVTTNGTLEVEGTLEVTGEITGDEKVVLAETATLDLDAGTLTLNETDEKFTDLTLGTTGIVEVSAGKSLTLTGDVDNKNTTDGIKLLADNAGYAQLLTSNAVLTDKGTTYAEQYFTSATNEGWRQIGSPVAATLAELEDDFTVNYSSAGSLQNLTWYNASPVSGTTAATGWVAAANGTENFGLQTNAYSFYTGGIAPSLNGGVLDVDGAVGNGDYTFDVYATVAAVQQTAENTGWNLIPNPYPSNISTTALIASLSLTYKNIHVWDAKAQQYVAISDNVVINFTPLATASHNIAPFQAFWVKGSSTPSNSATATEDITLTNAHRTISDNYNVFKAAPALIRLNATADNGDIDQTVLTFEEGTVDGIEDRDAFKIKSLNEAKPNLFTRAEGKDLSINRLSRPAPDKHVPLFFEQKDNREFTIDLVEATVDNFWMIELEDHKTGALENLRTTTYTYKNDPSFVGNRFTVHINKTGKSVALNNAERVAIYGNDGGINVSFLSTKSQIADISIYNVAGQTLFTGRINTDETFVWPVNGIPALYVVNVKLLTETFTEKVVR